MKHCTVIPIKDQKVMYVRIVESGVCGFYTTLHTGYCYSCWRYQRLFYSVYSSLSPLAGARGYLFEPSVLGVQWFTTSQSEEAALLTFLNFSDYKGDCRQDTQPIPNS